MRVILQRVSTARVQVNQRVEGEIGAGLLILVGFEAEETQEEMDWIANKLVQLRIFGDENKVMNLSLEDVEGELLIISQFTLHAKTKKGNRPSYIKAAKPDNAIKCYEQFIATMKKRYQGKIETGIFGADMQVSLTNDGPVTISLDSKNKE